MLTVGNFVWYAYRRIEQSKFLLTSDAVSASMMLSTTNYVDAKYGWNGPQHNRVSKASRESDVRKVASVVGPPRKQPVIPIKTVKNPANPHHLYIGEYKGQPFAHSRLPPKSDLTPVVNGDRSGTRGVVLHSMQWREFSRCQTNGLFGNDPSHVSPDK